MLEPMRACFVVLSLLVFAGRADADVDLVALTKAAPGCDAARAHCVGLSLHIAIGDAGPVATADWITAQLAGANRHFTALDLGFRIVAVDALPASATRVDDRKERDSFGPRVQGTVIHVFVTGHLDDVDVAGQMAYGVTWRKGSTKFIILSTQAWERTLAHELGHVFGLPHSTYAISIMNKSDRAEPPIEQRTFAAEELKAMRPRLVTMLRGKIITDLPKPTP